MPVWLNLIVFPWGWLALVATFAILLIRKVVSIHSSSTNDAELKKNYKKSVWKIGFYVVAIIFTFWAAQALNFYRPVSTLENPAQQQIDQREKQVEQFVPPTEAPTIAPKLDIIVEENKEKRQEQHDKSIDDFKKLIEQYGVNTTPVGGALPSTPIAP